MFPLNTDDEVRTRTGQKQTMMTQSTDKVLRSLSPLINSMRPFGLYFTRPLTYAIIIIIIIITKVKTNNNEFLCRSGAR